MNNFRKKKAVALSLGLAAVMLSIPSVQAQGVFGNLLDEYYEEEHQNSCGGLLGRGSSVDNLERENYGTMTNGDINVEDFGTPVGSGVLVLLAAGVGYASMKKSNNGSTKENN